MLKILSVDDSRSVHAFLRECFSETSHEIDFAFNGEEALDKQRNGQYDLVLLDWEMPGLTGPEVLKKLKEEGFDKPIIMLTSKNRVDDIREVIESGASEYIMKPFNQEIIFEKLKSVLGIEIKE